MRLEQQAAAGMKCKAKYERRSRRKGIEARCHAERRVRDGAPYGDHLEPVGRSHIASARHAVNLREPIDGAVPDRHGSPEVRHKDLASAVDLAQVSVVSEVNKEV